MKERWLNGCLIKPDQAGGWQVSLGIHTQTFKTRSKAVKFALSVRANHRADHETRGAMPEPKGVGKYRPANGGWVPRCIAGGGRPRKVSQADERAIAERMFNGCLIDEMGNGTWRVQYQDENPTPAQQRLGFDHVGFHQRTFKTRDEAISFTQSLPKMPEPHGRENPIQDLANSVLGKRRRRRLVQRSRTI